MKKVSHKLVFRLIVTFIVLFTLAFLIFNQNGLLKFINLKKEIDQLDAQIKNADKKIKALELEIDSLNNSKDKINRVAREKFHMMKSNERVIKIEEN